MCFGASCTHSFRSLSNGFIIKIGRGLHIFKPTGSRYVIGFMDYHFRQCLETNVDIFKCKQNV